MASSSSPPTQPTITQPPNVNPTRFTLELEFVTALSNPSYLSYLATQKYLTNPVFVAYLDYLLYWTKPPYTQYLMYPEPTLKTLQMLQHEEFRRDVLRPEVLGRWAEALLGRGVGDAAEVEVGAGEGDVKGAKES
ncbi:suppressor of hpr1 [Agyrium rufum]|nr:suppressor of hpr1 [Agyrium rufum]